MLEGKRRRRLERLPSRLSLREWLVLVTASLPIIIGPWMEGAMRWYYQAVLAGLCVPPFLMLLIPLRGASSTVGQNLKAVLRFPALIPGLLVLIYIGIQLWNVAWDFVPTPLGWTGFEMLYRNSESFITWLPQGFEGRFEIMDGWRHLIILSAMWLLFSAIWGGLRRRKALIALLWVVGINGAILSLVVILQKVTGTNQILWTFESGNPSFAGTFHYRNHAACYLYACLGVNIALGFYHARQAARELRASSPVPLFVFQAVLIVFAIFMTGSRASMIFTTLLLMLCGSLLLGKMARSGIRVLLTRLLAIGALAGVVLTLTLPIVYPHIEESVQRFLPSDKASGLDPGLRIRASKMTFEMFSDNLWYGWGAGSFYYFFPHYQQRDMQLMYRAAALERERHVVIPWERRRNIMLRISHAHNDWMQYLAEYGVVGFGLLLLSLGMMLAPVLRNLHAVSTENLVLMATVGLILLHAVADFMLSNPAILTVMCLLLTLNALLLAEHQRPRNDREQRSEAEPT